MFWTKTDESMNMPMQDNQTRRKMDALKFRSPEPDYSKEILIDEEEIIGQLFKTGSEKKFLGILTEKEIFVLLRKCKVLNSLHKQGFNNAYVEIVNEDPFNHILRLCCDGFAGKQLLVELVIQKMTIPSGKLLKDFAARQKMEMLFVDWQVLSANNSLDDYFKSKLYTQLKEEAYFENQYVLDIEKYNAQKNKITELAEVII